MPDGMGVLYDARGNKKYDGLFANGTPTGRGAMYAEDGTLIRGN